MLSYVCLYNEQVIYVSHISLSCHDFMDIIMHIVAATTCDNLWPKYFIFPISNGHLIISNGHVSVMIRLFVNALKPARADTHTCPEHCHCTEVTIYA